MNEQEKKAWDELVAGIKKDYEQYDSIYYRSSISVKKDNDDAIVAADTELERLREEVEFQRTRAEYNEMVAETYNEDKEILRTELERLKEAIANHPLLNRTPAPER
jgi:hypothetical protein